MNPFDVLSVEIRGESHSPCISVEIGNLPLGESFAFAEVDECLGRRKSGKYLFSTPRREDDSPVWESGVEARGDEGVITGTVKARIDNRNIRPADYTYTRTPRPSHADYTSFVKDGADAAASGGGRFSGRMTAPLVIAGAIAKSLLRKRGVEVAAYISRLAGVSGKKSDCDIPSPDEIRACLDLSLPMITGGEEAAAKVAEIAKRGDSAGGVVECVAYGLPAGLGDNLWQGLESKISAVLYGIPAVKGVEFGAGFAIADMTGAVANDAFVIKDGAVATATNNAGGINGGISNGMPLVVRAAFRPTPSVSLPQRTVDLTTMTETEISVKGRHDATVVPRATVVTECAVALALYDEMLKRDRENKRP